MVVPANTTCDGNHTENEKHETRTHSNAALAPLLFAENNRQRSQCPQAGKDGAYTPQKPFWIHFFSPHAQYHTKITSVKLTFVKFLA